MTAKEKAFEILYKVSVATDLKSKDKRTKLCSLLIVDEIDDIYQKLTPKDDPYYFLLELEYWQEVKQEIETL